MSALLTLEEAQARLLALAADFPQPSTQALWPSGDHLAHDILALRTQPAADLSSMDGYAICGAGQWRLVGESRAGAPFEGVLGPGQCARISTGALMPAGSDRVLIQEDATVLNQHVSAAELPEAGRHVRKQGFDFRTGDVVLRKGTRMGPGQIALLHAAGHSSAPVRSGVQVAILECGDELVNLPGMVPAHLIPASNGAMLRAMLGQCGRVSTRMPEPVRDDPDAIKEQLTAFDDAPIIVTSGGASVGDHDHVQEALKASGAQIEFWKVAIKPGKPLLVATRQLDGINKRQIILGLPGNPVSSFVTAFLFAVPLVKALLGERNPLPSPLLARAQHAFPATGARREFLRGIAEEAEVRLAASQDSSALRSLASANCLIDRPAEAASVRKGELVPVYNLQNG